MRYDGDLRGWLEGLFRTIDDLDTAAFLNYLTPDARFRFGSAPAVEGHEAIHAAVDTFFETIAGCRHELRRSWQDNDSVVCEGRTTYRRHDGSEITVPFADVFVLRDRLIERYSIYADLGPLYETG